mmetsp:Transcript_109918/g.215463  ORF Transcript_109918/g.215463 Transcript_109918/m.215463 type:complete len:237 (-) Transcript_109918:560-1270(-)
MLRSSKRSVQLLKSFAMLKSANCTISMVWRDLRAKEAERVTLPMIFSPCSSVVAVAVAVADLRREKILFIALKRLWKICTTERQYDWQSPETSLAQIAKVSAERPAVKRPAKSVTAAVCVFSCARLALAWYSRCSLLVAPVREQESLFPRRTSASHAREVRFTRIEKCSRLTSRRACLTARRSVSPERPTRSLVRLPAMLSLWCNRRTTRPLSARVPILLSHRMCLSPKHCAVSLV